MFFDIHVKKDLDEFYNYRQELKQLIESIKHNKIIVIKGLRRVGKTSLMSVAYNLIEGPKVFLDSRDFKDPFQLMNKAFIEIYSQIDPTKKIFEVLSVDIGPFTLKLSESEISLSKIDKKLGQRKGIIFIDEIQELEGLDKLIAYTYDHTKNIVFIISGSEIGVLDKLFLPDKPLFGRLSEIITLSPLPPNKSLNFLRLGFAQEGKEYNEVELREAVKELDGLIGWLTYYGYLRRNYPHNKSLEILKKNAKLLITSELTKFLKKKKGEKARYLLIVKALKEPKSWSEIKDYLEFKLKKKISNARVHNYLEQLIEFGFVVKDKEKYRLADPLLSLL